MSLRSTLESAARDLVRDDLPPAERAIRLADRILRSSRVHPRITVSRRLVFELTRPPPKFRGLRDLVVRRARSEDAHDIGITDDTSSEQVRQLLARGDLAYVGLLGDRVLCKTCFHPGPTPFDESYIVGVSWELSPSTFWSYAGAATVDARATGVFIKLFATALCEIYEMHGATRVLGWIRDTNHSSIALHERMGWQRLGALVTVALPGVKWVFWEGAGGPRRWIARRSRPLLFSVPPS